MSLDVVCFGEILWDLFETRARGREPIARTFRRELGGAPANVAVGLARLGVGCAIVGGVGRDRFGDAIVADLRRERVDTRFVVRLPERTGLTFVTRDWRGEPEFIFYRHESADVSLRPEHVTARMGRAGWALVGTSTSMTRSLAATTDRFLDAADKAGAAVLVDLNVRAHLWPDARTMRTRMAWPRGARASSSRRATPISAPSAARAAACAGSSRTRRRRRGSPSARRGGRRQRDRRPRRGERPCRAREVRRRDGRRRRVHRGVRGGPGRRPRRPRLYRVARPGPLEHGVARGPHHGQKGSVPPLGRRRPRPPRAGPRASSTASEQTRHHEQSPTAPSPSPSARPAEGAPPKSTGPTAIAARIHTSSSRATLPVRPDARDSSGEIRFIETTDDQRELEDIQAVGGYALSLKWFDGHSSGIYSFTYLRALCPCDACRTGRSAGP